MWYPDTMLSGSRFALLLDLSDSESVEEHEETGSPPPETPVESEECCICMDSLARVTLSPCNHSKFCEPCITVVVEDNGPCPLCRAPILGSTVDGGGCLAIHREHVIEKCCICHDREACVQVLPCGDSSFCATCIFTERRMDRPCPCCMRPIFMFNMDPDTRLENFQDLLEPLGRRGFDRYDIQTVGELEDFTNDSIFDIVEAFYHNWCIYHPN